MDVPQKLIHLKTINVDEDFERVYYDNEIDDETVEYVSRNARESIKMEGSEMVTLCRSIYKYIQNVRTM